MSDELKIVAAGGEGGLRAETHAAAALPAEQKLDADSPAFFEAVSKCLPADVSGSVMEFHASARSRYRRFEILLIVLGLCAVGWFTCLYFPKPVPAPPFQFEWRYDGPRFPGDSPYLARYASACAAFDEEHYEKVLEILREPLRDMEETLPAGCDALFYLYFVSCERAGAGEEWARAVSLARRLAGQDRDNLQWRYFLVLSQRRSFPGCREFYRELREGKWLANWERKLLDVNLALKDLRILEAKVRNRRRLPQKEQICTQLALFRAELLTLKWMLEGGRGTADFSDNEGDPGVTAREMAWASIQNRREAPFVELRMFILETLLEQDAMLNGIFWNGAMHWTQQPLKTRLKEEAEALQGGDGK